jgi:hypothetical protein
MDNEKKDTGSNATWFVGASYGGTDDQMSRYLADGIWENGYDDKLLDIVRSMRPGERIAIKSSYTRKHGLPFDSRGRAVSVMGIKAVGTITENLNDGKRVIRRAVERGVTPEKLAKALDVDISHIIKKLNLLDGICPEAAELLRDQTFSANLGAVLRKLKPTRQVECVELMVSANNITVAYAQALVAATPSNLLVGETKPKKMTGVSADQMAKMEREMGNLQEQFKLAEQTYGQDILNLVLAKGYLAKLMANEAILRHLTRNHPDVLNEFDSIVRLVALDK